MIWMPFNLCISIQGTLLQRRHDNKTFFTTIFTLEDVLHFSEENSGILHRYPFYQMEKLFLQILSSRLQILNLSYNSHELNLWD